MMDSVYRLDEFLVAVGIIGVLPGCVIDDPNHCHNSGVPCAEGLVCDPCTPSNQSSNGCVPSDKVSDQEPGLPGCQAGWGTVPVSTTDVDPTETTAMTVEPTETSLDPDATATVGDTETTTGPPVPCMDDDECSGSTPFCGNEGVCVNCSGVGMGRCAEIDPTMPLCFDGECVQCIDGTDTSQCGGETPICDPGTNMCIGCTAHADCGEAACNFFNGACLDMQVLHAGSGQTYPTIQAALDMTNDGERSTIVLHTGTSFDESIDIDGGRELGLLAAPTDLPQWTSSTNPQLMLSDGMVVVEGLRIFSNDTSEVPGVFIDGGFAWFDRTRIADNAGGALMASGADAVVLRNCFLAGRLDATVVDIQSSTVEVLYSTIGANFGMATGIACDAGSAVTVRNSIVVSRDAADEIMCSGIMMSHTATENTPGGDENEMLGDVDVNWFIGGATSYNAGNFFLSPTGMTAFENVASWQAGDPATDIDGDPRPNVAGTDDYAGADIP